MNSQGPKTSFLSQLGLAAAPRKVRAGGYSDREKVGRFATVALLTLVLLGPIMTFGGMNLSDEGTVERQIGYLVVLALTLYSAFPVATRLSLVAMPVPVLVAFGWCWISLTWAIEPSDSFRRLVLTTTVAWTVFLVVRHAGYRSTIEIVRWCLAAAVIISYFVVFLDPQTGIHMMSESAAPTALVGDWRGFLGHKNFAGAVCALCIIVFTFDAKRLSAVVRVIVIGLAVYFLYRSQSKTSAGMLVLAVAGGVMFTTLNQRLRAYLIPILTVFGSVIWATTSFYNNFLETNLFNPTAFTGRGHIWSVLLKYAGDHWMFGAGFGSFWNIGPASPIFSYGQGYVTEITVGHSGYIDQLITVGFPGLVLMIFAVMIWPFWKLLRATDLAAEQGAVIAAILMFCIGHNITESGLFERDAIVSTFLFFAAAFAQYSGTSERRSSGRAGEGDEILRTMRRRRDSPVVS